MKITAQVQMSGGFRLTDDGARFYGEYYRKENMMDPDANEMIPRDDADDVGDDPAEKRRKASEGFEDMARPDLNDWIPD